MWIEGSKTELRIARGGGTELRVARGGGKELRDDGRG